MKHINTPIKLEKVESGYRLSAETFIPAPLDEVFAFFSRAENLETITPKMLNFRFVTPPPADMEQGVKITYRLQVHGFPVRWVTEISVWEPPYRFVDTQLQGPYKHWIHEHRFEAKGEGTLMTDTVHYALPFGILGKIAHGLFVHRDVVQIFAYRQDQIQFIFGRTVSEQG